MVTKRIRIFDTTLRDGEQSPGVAFTVDEKVRMARQLERLGVDVIEAGFPISSPANFQAVEAISRQTKNCSVCALARAVQKDIEVAAEALKRAVQPRINLGFGVSDNHLKYKFNGTTREQGLQRGIDLVRYARKYVEDVEYFLEDASRAERAYLCQVIEAVITAGARTINVCDTVGYATPEEYGALIAYIREHVPNIDRAVLSAHCHNDLGMATANSLAAVQHGAGQIECTVNGIGERAGNTPLEEVVMALRTRRDQYACETGIVTSELYPTSSLVSAATLRPIPVNKPIVGAYVFSHTSGIHQKGVLQHPTTYEILNRQDVGVPEITLPLTSVSGRAALTQRLGELGYEFAPEEIDPIYARFLAMADRKKQVDAVDLHLIMEPAPRS